MYRRPDAHVGNALGTYTFFPFISTKDCTGFRRVFRHGDTQQSLVVCKEQKVQLKNTRFYHNNLCAVQGLTRH